MTHSRSVAKRAVPLLGAVALAFVPGRIAGDRPPSPPSVLVRVAPGPSGRPDTIRIATAHTTATRATPDLRRNPFAFAPAPRRAPGIHASGPPPPTQPQTDANATSRAAEWPALIGIVEERDGTRTAVLLDAKGELIFAVTGSIIDGGYRVRQIDVDGIHLLRVATGDARVSRLR